MPGRQPDDARIDSEIAMRDPVAHCAGLRKLQLAIQFRPSASYCAGGFTDTANAPAYGVDDCRVCAKRLLIQCGRMPIYSFTPIYDNNRCSS